MVRTFEQPQPRSDTFDSMWSTYVGRPATGAKTHVLGTGERAMLVGDRITLVQYSVDITT